MIQHTVAFRLKHDAGSADEAEFLAATAALTEIPSVKNFRCLRQISSKNDFTFGLSMEFSTREDYDLYCAHEIHEQFVADRWIPEVAEFMEIDYVVYDPDRGAEVAK